jgi:hypothetical protein
MERYKPYKFEEAIDSIQDFNNLIEGILKDSFDEMVDKFIEDINNFDNNYISSRKNELESPYSWSFRRNIRNYNIKILDNIYLQRSPHTQVTKHKDADKLIKIEATKRAKEIQDSYRARLHSKLFLILKNKELKDVKIVKLQLSIFYDATIKFMFKDGSEFILNSQIVLSTSKLGTMFYRFPNIYQNIIMPDGSKIKKQSEEWMLINFAKVNIDQAKQAKKALDPNSEARELRKLNFQNKRYYGVTTINGKIEIGNKFKIDYQSQNSDLKNIEDIHINFNMPEVRTTSSGFLVVDDIKGKSGTANISYKDGTEIIINITNIARNDVGKFKRNGVEEIHYINPKALKYSSNSYFMGLSGNVKEIVSKN